MRYLQRDENGVVIGHYANPQKGYAEEEVPDDHEEILAWYARAEAIKAEYDAKQALMGPEALLARIQLLEEELAKLKA